MKCGFIYSFPGLIAAACLVLPSGAYALQTRAKCVAQPIGPAARQEVIKGLKENYAYFSRVGKDADFLVRLNAAAAKAKTSGELGMLIQKMGFGSRDGHFVAAPVVGDELPRIPGLADIWLEYRGGNFVVSDVKAGSEAALKGVRPGWTAISVNGQATGKVARDLLTPLFPNPSDHQIEYAANVVAAGALNAPRVMTFSDQGKSVRLNLSHLYAKKAPRPRTALTTEMKGDVAIIRFNNQLGNNDAIALFDSAMKDVRGSKALILDLRDTPSGGNTTVARAIMGHFISERAIYQRHDNVYETAVFGVPRTSAEYVSPRGEQYQGKVVVLAGRWTGSVGEALAIGMDAVSGAHSIGTGLADLLGDLRTLRFQKTCLEISFAFDALSHANGTPRENWLPDEVLISGDTGPNGVDPGMHRALQYLSRAGIPTQ